MWALGSLMLTLQKYLPKISDEWSFASMFSLFEKFSQPCPTKRNDEKKPISKKSFLICWGRWKRIRWYTNDIK
jgi:hypothetical protein